MASTSKNDESNNNSDVSLSGRRRRRVVNYNVDYISNAAYEKATEELNNQMGNGRKRKKNQSASSPKSLTQQPRKKQCNSNDSNSSSLALKPKYPWDSWNFDSLFGYARVAANASRKSNARNYNFDEKLPVACGGFRLLVRICPDAFIKSFRSRINEDEVVRGETDDETTFDVQLLRHAWNRLSESERLRWEMEARKEVKEAEKVAGCERGLCPEKPDQNDASIRHRTDDVNEVEGAVRDITGEVKQGSEQCNMDVMDSVSKDDEPVADGSHAVKTSMPSCEIRFHSSRAISDSEAYNKLNFGVFRCHLCPQKVTLAGADAFQLHLIQNHHSARFYACHLCFEAFSSLEFLKKHPCQEFASYTVGLLTANKQFAMKFVMHTLVCAECNLQMPLPANRQVSSTKRLASLMKVHNCDNLVSCLVYFAEQPNGVVHVTIRGLPLKRSIPISCSVCNQQFTTVSDIEQHGADHGLPKLKCHLCPRFFFSDLLYREHLLTHLGDNQYSMIPVIGSSTLTPPSWMHNDFARMGCEMDCVLGPYCELSVPNRVNEEVSSDEDVINTRDTVKKKRLEKKALDGDKNKRKKMNANFAKKKKSGEGDRCIHCRQLERFKSGCKPTDLCTCVSWLDRSSQLALQMPQVSFGDNNSFINSLTQKFTPIGHLYVGSCFAPIHDTIKGAIITDCVYMCMTCHMLRLGKKSALMHIRVCLQKNLVHRDPQKTIDFNDENIVMRLTYAQSTPNTRVSCPKCANTCCSIVSLRRHLALDHGIFAPFSPPEANKDIGIIEWTGAVRKVATLTEVTNVKLNLTRDGDFKMPSPQRYRTLYSSGPIIQQSSSSSVCAGSSSRIVEVDERTGEIRNGINVVTNVQPQDQTTVRCEICGVNQPSILEFANHLVANHLFYCEMCGEAFSEKTPLNLHKATCPPWAHKTNDGEHLPFCPFCHFIFSTPGRYYKHIAHMHLEHVKLDRETHKLLPRLIWKKMSLSEACKRKRLGSSALSMPLQQMVLTQSAVVPQESSSSNQDASVIQSSSNTLQQNLFNEPKLPYCLLCEGVFATIGTRDAHLRKHEEQWKDCPVCQMERVTHEVTSHEELFQHVIAKHSRRTVSGQEVTMICSLCYTCLKSDSSQTLRRIEEQIFRHIIYMCNTVDRCFICNNGRTIQPDDLKKHRKKQHNHLYERFGCSACPKKFFTHGDYSEHICNLRIQCACGARDEFSEREYEKHFKTHLNFVGDFCLLCNKYLASKQQRYTHAGVHRLARPGDRREIDLNHKSRLSSSRTASSSLINAPSVAQSKTSINNNSSLTQSECNAVNQQNLNHVKQENEDDEDDVIFIDVHQGSEQQLNQQSSENTQNQQKVLSETMSATQSIVSQSMPVPNTFLANVRMESDNSQTAPICERSHATLPRINISNETNKEAVNGVVERLVNEVAGEAEQFDEESQRTSSSSSTSPRSTPPPQLNDERQQTTMQHLIESTQARRSQLNPSNSGDVILILQMPPPNDCQQVSSDQQISYHTIVQALATGGTIQQNAPTIVGSCSNDNNSNNNNNNNNNNNGDDDDDDIQIIEDDEAVMDKQTNTNTAHDTGEKTGHADDSEQNDGVVVQNADVVDENAITASESLHLEEIHDEGDDEVQAVAAGKGLGIEKAKKREPKIVCPHCTAKFVTHVALEAHSASHRYDAGNTIEEVLGVPLKETVYICRLCCLAYESETVYGRHMQTHGQLQNCPYCSMVAFNEDQLQQHLQQHTNAGQCLTYACYRCADTYSSDERLYHHAMRRHQLMLMYYCKNCGIGSTDGKIVYNHIVRHACVSQQAALSSASKLGVAPASMFHYQPLKVKQYEDAVSKSTLSVVTPSDCIHRSFLISQNEHILITCPLCYCLISFNRLRSEFSTLTTNYPGVLYRGTDDNGDILSAMIRLWRTARLRKDKGGTAEKKNDNRSQRPVSPAALAQPYPAPVISQTVQNLSVLLSQPSSAVVFGQQSGIPLSASNSNNTNNLQVSVQSRQQQIASSSSSTLSNNNNTTSDHQTQSSAPPLLTPSVTIATTPSCSSTPTFSSSLNTDRLISGATFMLNEEVNRIMRSIQGSQRPNNSTSSSTTYPQSSTSTSGSLARAVTASSLSSSTNLSNQQQRVVDSIPQLNNNNNTVNMSNCNGQVTQSQALNSAALRQRLATRHDTVNAQQQQQQSFNRSSSSKISLAQSSTIRQQQLPAANVRVRMQPKSLPPSGLRQWSSANSLTNASGTGTSGRSNPSTSSNNYLSSRQTSHSISSQRSTSTAQSESIIPISENYIIRNSRGELVCKLPECTGIRIDKLAVGHVHNLRHNIHNNYFCLECGTAFTAELFAIKHQIQVHHNGVVPEVKLRCLWCAKMPVFHTASAFKTHLKEHVGRELKFPMQSNRLCDMAFANEDARFLHEKEHAKSKSSICCVLCGTSSGYWSVPISQLYPPLEHAYIHAFSLWAMCRECGLCFPNEVKKEQFISHYQQTHWLSSSSRCAVCDIPLAGQHVHSHALKRHFVLGIKTDRNKPFVVTVSESLLNSYLGFAVSHNARV